METIQPCYLELEIMQAIKPCYLELEIMYTIQPCYLKSRRECKLVNPAINLERMQASESSY